MLDTSLEAVSIGKLLHRVGISRQSSKLGGPHAKMNLILQTRVSVLVREVLDASKVRHRSFRDSHLDAHLHLDLSPVVLLAILMLPLP